MNLTFFYFVLTLIGVSIPLETFIPWLTYKIRQVDAKVIRSRSMVYLSKQPFFNCLIYALNIAKGYLPLFFGLQLFDNEYAGLFIVLTTLLLNNWSIWHKLSNRQNFWFILFGIYLYFYPSLSITFAIAYIIISLLSNSLLLGLMLSIISMFFAFWIIMDSPIYLLVNLGIFIIAGFAYLDELLLHFDGNSQTIKQQFLQRK